MLGEGIIYQRLNAFLSRHDDSVWQPDIARRFRYQPMSKWRSL